MIIARGTNESLELLILGLSGLNVKKLKAGMPISVNSDVHPGVPKGWQIVIIYGETEADLEKAVGPAIGPHTEISDDPNLPE